MKIRSCLTAAAVGSLMAAAIGGPATAGGTAVPDEAGGRVLAWGTAAAAPQTEVPDSLDDKVVVAVDAGINSTLAVTDDGKVTAWGGETAAEVLGMPNDLENVQAVSVGQGNALALHDDGSVTGWGATATIADVPEGLKATAVKTATTVAYAVKPDGTVATWGTPQFATPDLENVVDVDAGSTHSMALHADGTVTVWAVFAGLPVVTVPTDVQGHAVAISAGSTNAAALLDDGTVRIWGGMLNSETPEELDEKEIVEIDVFTNAVARTADGEVFAWGGSGSAVIPLNTLPDELDGEQAAAVTAGQNHIAALVTTFRAVTPAAITGAPQVGQTLTGTPAEFSLDPDSTSQQWLADGDPIDDATGGTLELDDALLGKQITFSVAATRGTETVESTSAPVGPVTPTTVDSTTTVAVSPASAGYGSARSVTATVAKQGGTPTGSVTVKAGSHSVTAALAGGKATVVLPATLPVGSHSVTATYGGDITTNPSTSTAATLVVTKAASKAKVAKTKVAKKGKKVVVRVKVTAAGSAKATGKVKIVIKRGKKKVAAANVKVNAKGVAKLNSKKLKKKQARQLTKRGKYKINATYKGSTTVLASKGKGKFKV